MQNATETTMVLPRIPNRVSVLPPRPTPAPLRMEDTAPIYLPGLVQVDIIPPHAPQNKVFQNQSYPLAVPEGSVLISEHKRNGLFAYILLFTLGVFGAHHFYLKRRITGVIYACTFGLLLMGVGVDLFITWYYVRRCNRKIAERATVVLP